MRGNDIHRRASKRIRSDHRTTATGEFDHRILQDGVHDDVIQDDQLAQLEDAVATLEDVRDERRNTLGTSDYYDRAVAADTASAVSSVAGDIDRRVLEVCAERCVVVIQDGDDWVAEGYEDADVVADAKHEAREWLQLHLDVAERVGALEVLD